MKSFQWALLLSLTLLSSCGFYLRGLSPNGPQWIDSIAIVVENNRNDLDGLLGERLQAYNIPVCLDPAQAHYWLIIQNTEFRQQISSISSSTTPRQYQLTYTVWFKFQTRQGLEIIPLHPVQVMRQITLNSDRILGSEGEEATFRNEMRRDATVQILTQLSHLKVG